MAKAKKAKLIVKKLCKDKMVRTFVFLSIVSIAAIMALNYLSDKFDTIASDYDKTVKMYCDSGVLYGNQPIENLYSESIEEDKTYFPSDCPSDIAEYTMKLCKETGIDANLVFALMYCESTYNKDAVNVNNDCYGLMQISSVNDGFAKEIGCPEWKTDWQQNIEVGVALLATLENKYSATEALILAYTEGEKGAESIFASGSVTTDFTEKVNEKYKEYSSQENVCIPT